MAIGSSLSGLRPDTADNIVLDAGVVYVNANIQAMLANNVHPSQAFALAIDPLSTWVDPNGNTVAPRKLGATRGGTQVQLNKEERQVEVDGRRFNIKGLQRVDMMDPKIVTSLLEVGDAETLKLALGSTVVEAKQNFVTLRPYLYPTSDDYYGNMTLFATIAGRTFKDGAGIDQPLPIVVVLENCRANNVQEISVEDRNEAVLQVELTGHALPGDAFTCPMMWIVPKKLAELGYY